MAFVALDVPVLKWSGTEAAWTDVCGRVPTHEPAASYTTLTWNVWFHGYEKTMDQNYYQQVWLPRQMALLAECRATDADFLCFQEVTCPATSGPGRGSFLELLLAEEWIRQEYYISDATGGNTFSTWYGVVMASRIPIARFVVLALPTKLGRALLVAHVHTGRAAEDIAIGTAHLESPVGNDSSNIRVEQLRHAVQYFKALGVQTSIFMGDFNITNPKEMAAIWEVAGWTDLNDGASTWFQNKWRPDRVIVSSSSYRAVGGCAQVVGNAPSGVQVLGPDGLVTTPSDHFALKTKFVRVSSCVAGSSIVTGGQGGLAPGFHHCWTVEQAEEAVAPGSYLIFHHTRVVSDAIYLLGDPSLWSYGECYVYSDYKQQWYKLWSCNGRWSLECSQAIREVVPALIFDKARSVSDAVSMLNADPSMWSHAECFVYSDQRLKWYRLWPRGADRIPYGFLKAPDADALLVSAAR